MKVDNVVRTHKSESSPQPYRVGIKRMITLNLMECTHEHSAFWDLGENKYPDSEEGTFLQHYWKPLAGTVPVCVFLGWREKGRDLAQQF